MQAPLDPPEIYTWNSWVIVHRGKCVQVQMVRAAPLVLHRAEGGEDDPSGSAILRECDHLF